MRPGDTIVGVAGRSIAGKPLEEYAEELLGPEGTEVILDIVSTAGGIPKPVTITRKPFHIPTVEYVRMSGNIGYIRIASFSTDTAELVTDALALFRNGQPINGLIVDVRGNPGGYLDSVLEVSKQFIKEGRLLYTTDRNGTKESIDITNGYSINVPVTVLTDSNSASAAEVFAGAMQDYKKAVIVGSRTFGKGSVQQLIPLETGGGLRLTIEHYLTPMGHEVNQIGIRPDRLVAHPLQQTVVAMKAVGANSFRIRLGAYETEINRAIFETVVPIVRENGRTYVQSTALAALADGTVAWDGTKRQVFLQGLQRKGIFGINNGLLLKDGASYIALDAFTRVFTNVTVQSATDSVVLEMKQDG
jgi:carboxyl-terminal processing protease